MLERLNLRFATILLVYGGAVYLVYRDEVLGGFLTPLAELTAHLVQELFRLLDIEVLRVGAILAHPEGFAYEIAYTCTGFLPVTTFIMCILAYPGSLGAKAVGIALGVPALATVNLLRLVTLFYIGLRFPDAFAVAHEVVWEVLLAVVFIGLWLGWIRWSSQAVCPERSGP